MRVGDVFDYFHVYDDVELFACCGHRLCCGVPIVDRKARLGGMDFGHWDVPCSGIHSDNIRANVGNVVEPRLASPPSAWESNRSNSSALGIDR